MEFKHIFDASTYLVPLIREKFCPLFMKEFSLTQDTSVFPYSSCHFDLLKINLQNCIICSCNICQTSADYKLVF